MLKTHNACIPSADLIRELFLDPTVIDAYAVREDIRPDIDTAREDFREWGMPDDAADRSLERIADATVATGVHDWT